MKHSATLWYNKQRIKADGKVTLYIQVIVNREKEYINLKFDWPLELVDFEAKRLLQQGRNVMEAADYNIIINAELGKINEIFRLARLADRTLTLSEFRAEYKNFASREDFLIYFDQKLNDRHKKGIIRDSTAAAHASSLSTLQDFVSVLPFNQVTVQFLEDYKAYMYKVKKYDSDTALTKLKNLRTYLNLAKLDGHIFNYPFGKGFKMPAEQRRIDYLNEDEFLLLKEYFKLHLQDTKVNKEHSVRAWLFMSYTGVRLGDMKQLTHENIKKGILRYAPQKSKSDLQKEVEVPLHLEAKKLIITKKGPLFYMPSDAKMRENLAEIAELLDFDTRCSPHVARHTFATRFLRAGGRLEVLKELMGHEDIKTTLIYVHVDLKRKQDEISLLT